MCRYKGRKEERVNKHLRAVTLPTGVWTGRERVKQRDCVDESETEKLSRPVTAFHLGNSTKKIPIPYSLRDRQMGKNGGIVRGNV